MSSEEREVVELVVMLAFVVFMSALGETGAGISVVGIVSIYRWVIR